jgi:hypothetical protein
VGPFTIGESIVRAGLTTGRNSPSEWGGGWEGFGRRFASNMAKDAIKNTSIYVLDETMKLDSKFYRSRDRHPSARIRNAIFSAVTARDREGKRVLGVPKLVGTFSSNIIASTTWYPKRYDLEHGLKGGVISLGMNVAFNMVKEFVWKK